MSFKLNQCINQDVLVDKMVTNEVVVRDKIIYVDFNGTSYKYNKDNYYQLCGEEWINLRGGVPDYIYEGDSNPDENIFYQYDLV